VKLLDDSEYYVRWVAINCLASLGAQGTYSIVHFKPFALLRPLPTGVTAGYPAKDFRGGEIAGGFQHGCSSGRE
jgi:hypothetical protein